MKRNTNTLSCPLDFSWLAQQFRVSEAELLASLNRCVRFLPHRFRQMLASHVYG